MARKRNPRRLVIEHVHAMKKRTEQILARWNVAMTVMEDETYQRDGKTFRRSVFRPRRDDEKPENSLQHWDGLAAMANGLREQAEILATYAQQQADQIRNA